MRRFAGENELCGGWVLWIGCWTEGREVTCCGFLNVSTRKP